MKNTTRTIIRLIPTLLLFFVSGCKEPVPPQPSTAAPKIEWAANPDFSTVEISDEMDINVVITAEAGIKGLIVAVDSHVLSPWITFITADGTSTMDLIGDMKLIGMLTFFGVDIIPFGNQLRDLTKVDLSLSEIVPMIAEFSGKRDHDTNHVFTINMTDNENRTLSKSLTFHYSYAE